MKLEQLGEPDAAACADGVCEVPPPSEPPVDSAAQQSNGDQESTQAR